MEIKNEVINIIKNKEIKENKSGNSITLQQNTNYNHLPKETIEQSIKNLIQFANLSLNEDTINMVNKMLNNGISLNIKNLKKMKQITNLFSLNNSESYDKNVSKSIFALKNELHINSNNTFMIDNFAKGEGHISKLFNELSNNIVKITDNNLKDTIINTLLNNNKREKMQNINTYIPQINSTLKNQPPYINSDVKKLINTTNVQNENIYNNSELTKQPHTQNHNTITKSITSYEILKQPVTTNEVLVTKQNLHHNTYNKKLTYEPTSNHTYTQQQNISSTITQDEIISKDVAKKRDFSKNTNKEKPEIATQRDDNYNVTKLQISPTEITKALKKIYNVNFNDPQENIDQTLKKLQFNVNEALNILNATNLESLSENLTQINNTIEFITNLRDAIYLPLPLIINGNEADGAIYIFKDNHKKNSSTQSAVISLKTANLGKIETYIQKTNENISIQFKIESSIIEEIIKNNINLLTQSLKVISISYLNLNEPFNIIYSTQNLSDDIIVNKYKLDVQA